MLLLQVAAAAAGNSLDSGEQLGRPVGRLASLLARKPASQAAVLLRNQLGLTLM